MARADDHKIAAIRAGFQNGEINRFLHRLPIFQVDRGLPASIEEKLERLDQADREDAPEDGETGKR